MAGLDALEFDSDVPMAFPNTASFEGHRYLDPGLEMTGTLKPLLHPMLPVDLGSITEGPALGGSTLAVVTPTNLTSLSGVSDQYAPGGGNGQGFRYRVHRTVATTPHIPQMTLMTHKGDRISVRPRIGRTVTRADVELTVAVWMARQVELPPFAIEKHDIQSEVRQFEINGVTIHAAVWLWKGLAQIPDLKNTWRIYL